ncbi:MAG: polysaccharide deacetylase family protein, partial [Aliifodinibius sp.]|nr:polysaccharide deacetylase family protein [Fodinibius sp.]
GTAFLNKHGVKATFYVVPSAMEGQIDGWKEAVSNGHEIGNHTLNHPCTGNFDWKR